MAPTTTKKVSAKSSTKIPAAKTAGATPKSHAATHPSWVDMIKECIVSHPEEARSGVSRPLIKKFVESKYKLSIDAAAASQLNRAISHGTEKGTFSLPKGPSGKVKLASKAGADSAKENTKPPSKKMAATAKASTVPVKKPTSRPIPKAKTTKKAPAKTPRAAPATSSSKGKTSPGTALKASARTRTPSKKVAEAGVKNPAAVKAAPAPRKTTSTKKSAVKASVTGKAPKPTGKPKAKAVPAKPKVAAKRTPTKKTG